MNFEQLPSRRLPLVAVGVAFLAGAILTLVLVDRVLRFDSQAVATGVTIAATIVTTVRGGTFVGGLSRMTTTAATLLLGKM